MHQAPGKFLGLLYADNPFEMPDSDILDQKKGSSFPQAPKEIFPGRKPTSGFGGEGLAGGAADRAREEVRNREEKKEWENDSVFQSGFEVFVELDDPDAIRNKKRADFQLLHKQKGVFKVVATASGYNNPVGNVTVALPLYKPSLETTVIETAKPSFEHIKISEIHFSQNKGLLRTLSRYWHKNGFL